jgi:hypothetical protein
MRPSSIAGIRLIPDSFQRTLNYGTRETIFAEKTTASFDNVFGGD